ncbi:MAG: glycine zipper 2TM domain-containing protein [Sedimenticola sp.]|nr:glycine zipper 2TM domain-containing protein [Sedimenticola sp.]
MTTMTLTRLLAAALATSILVGCTGGLTGTTYSRSDARKVQSVQYGTVESVTPVVIEGRTDGIVGAGSGAVIGGLAGSSVGGGTGRKIATVVGAVAGGLAGQATEKQVTTRQGQELTIRLQNGELISIVQEVENDQYFKPGEQIRVLKHGGTTRVAY